MEKLLNITNFKTFVIIYYILINIIWFILYGIDKNKAKNRKWRIKEFTLLFGGFLGAGFGSFLAMQIFKHKTKHLKFKILVPIFIFLHIILLLIIFLK
ncbi:MAG: DUF1294 domain-containing protein [Oscillospiraceae bacterium]